MVRQAAFVGGFLAALCLAIAGVLLSVSQLPPLGQEPVDIGDSCADRNWLGWGSGYALGAGVLLVLLIYGVKGVLVLTWKDSPLVPVCWYAVLVTGSLPVIWFLVVLDWNNAFVFRHSCWVYDPLGLLLIPTVSFVVDLCIRHRLTPRTYALKSLLEILVLPGWLIFWAFGTFFCLGGGWI